MGLPSSTLLPCVLAAGCFYSPGSYSHRMQPFSGKRIALACLDVAVTLTEDDRAHDGPVVAYTFGNRCTHAATVDLGAVKVIGRAPDGTARPMHAYDPRRELRPLTIDGWFDAHEEIMYVADVGSLQPSVVCLDVGAVERVAARREHWVCLGQSDEGSLGAVP